MAIGRFGGNRRMTYYGRWTYKFEEAARRGAVAALIVHDTAGRWLWLAHRRRRRAGENYDIVREARRQPRVLLQGWLAGRGGDQKLFAAAGLDLCRTAHRRARRRRLSGLCRSEGRDAVGGPARRRSTPCSQSQRARDRSPATNTSRTRSMMFGAHWDAYGIGAARRTAGRTIRPGANDDGLGVGRLCWRLARAAVEGAAAASAASSSRIWTGEERGLLGSETYAADPIYPIGQDGREPDARHPPDRGAVARRDAGRRRAEPALKRLTWRRRGAAAGSGRVTPETLPERGLFYRADHFSPRPPHGVPTLLLMAISGAPDLVEGRPRRGTERGSTAICAAITSPATRSVAAVGPCAARRQDVGLIADRSGRRWRIRPDVARHGTPAPNSAAFVPRRRRSGADGNPRSVGRSTGTRSAPRQRRDPPRRGWSARSCAKLLGRSVPRHEGGHVAQRPQLGRDGSMTIIV